MPTLDKLASTNVVKMLLMGDSGTGKTGSLVSLVQAGYKLRILDFDGGLPILLAMIRKHCPDLIGNVEARSLSDKFVSGPKGPMFTPVAFVETTKMLDNWKYTYEGEAIDYGRPYTWGPDCVLVIDTLTFLSESALCWAQAMDPGAKDPRQWYFTAQGAIEDILAIQKSDSFNTNVIIISHVKYIERQDGTTKGYPVSAGSALSPNIPTYFNSVVLAQTKATQQRVLRTNSSALIDLKNPIAFGEELPQATGLATFFQHLRGPGPCTTTTIPSQPTKTLTKPIGPPTLNSAPLAKSISGSPVTTKAPVLATPSIASKPESLI